MNDAELAEFLMSQFLQSPHYLTLYEDASSSLQKPDITVAEVEKTVLENLKKLGWDHRIFDYCYHKLVEKFGNLTQRNFSAACLKEPLDFISKAQANWEMRIWKSLNGMCTELNVPLSRKRLESAQHEIASKWTELGTDEPESLTKDLDQMRPVYASKDFLDVVISVRNPNLNEKSFSSTGLVNVALEIPDISELKVIFKELSQSIPQHGLDDSLDSFLNTRVKIGKKVIDNGSSMLARQYLRQGCTNPFRSKLWSSVFSVKVTAEDVIYFAQLKKGVLLHDLLVDSLVYKDVKMTGTNDDHYFVFEDSLYQILLPFFRDTEVLKRFECSSATPPHCYIRGHLGDPRYLVKYPPNGIIPFHGFSMFVAPLCFVYDDLCELYYVFKKFYLRYFHYLHTLSSDPQGILCLCLLFESLFQAKDLRLWHHLISIDVQPLRIAFKWMFRAFAGFLSADQLLHLWDRLLGFNNLYIIPVLAVAIFLYRRSNLFEVDNAQSAEAVMSDLSTLDVMVLLQIVLFSA